MLVILASITYNLKDQQFIKDRFGGSLDRQFSLRTAERQYELGNAKRSQILILMINKIEIKWIGDGPYSYFDIRTGKFKKTKHFTQIIWTYFDLGLIGLVVLFAYIFSLIKYLDIDKGWPKLLFTGVILVYAFYTTILSDIAIMLSLMIIFNKKIDESSNNSISRLEEK
ncbi:hypothetical protein [Pontimicrobium sp. SW4]|uniref:Uncharacterized protein n=1 Tax=Pontimicrobium sp. SW4 TaxID=3153519 RepID=A0AAU7BSB4_9FLAO